VNQDFTGRAKYLPDVQAVSGDLFVVVRCQVGDVPDTWDALLDTGSQWCILPPAITLALGYELPLDSEIRLHSRFGHHDGVLIRIPMRFAADEGEPAEVEATWFVSPDWPGPMVTGWKGCLERFRFAFDPRESDFYFAEY
jgi:hypothetical protein